MTSFDSLPRRLPVLIRRCLREVMTWHHRVPRSSHSVTLRRMALQGHRLRPVSSTWHLNKLSRACGADRTGRVGQHDMRQFFGQGHQTGAANRSAHDWSKFHKIGARPSVTSVSGVCLHSVEVTTCPVDLAATSTGFEKLGVPQLLWRRS